MDEMIAHCGLICSTCPAYIATQNDDVQAKTELAAQWSKDFGHEMTVEDINCDGCTSSSTRLLGYCSMCEIRKCAVGKGVKNCAHCDDYGCEKLTSFHANVPPAKETLDNIRKGLV
jgi:hypothetical protein